MTVAKWEQPTLGPSSRDIVDGWGRQLADVAKLAGMIAGSPFVPEGLRSDAAVAAAVLTGREIGIGPMTSLAHMHVIKGRTGMSAELMRALVLARGHRIRFTQYDSARVALVGQRLGEPESPEFAWTIDDARRARLLGNPAWSQYPRAMLLSRATTELCRAVFPDVIGGLVYSTEELQDMAYADAPEAVPESNGATRTVRRRKDTPHPAAPSSSTDTGAPVSLTGPGGGPGESPAARPPLPAAGDLPPLPEDAETPPARGQNGPLPAEQPTPAQPPPDDGHKPVTPAQRGLLFELLGEVGASVPRANRIRVVSGLAGRRLSSLNQLTRRDASSMIDTLVMVRDSHDPKALDALVESGWQRIEPTEVDPPTVGADEDIDPNQIALWPDDDEVPPDDDTN